MMKNMNTELPDEIIELIFSKLNFLNLCKCRLICKAWSKLGKSYYNPKGSINSPIFITTLHSRTSKVYGVDLDPQHSDGIDVIASFKFFPTCAGRVSISILCFCNGLALLDYHCGVDHMLSVWNPITNEYIKLSSDATLRRDDYYGFGFSPETKCYKILRYKNVLARTNIVSRYKSVVDLLELGTSSRGQWTPVEFNLGFLYGNGTYFNGALYWVGVSMASASVVFRFDLQSEKFEEISFPESEELGRVDPLDFGFLGLLNGSLYLTFRTFRANKCVFRANKCVDYDAWKMGENCCWIKAFVVSLARLFNRPICQLQPIKICEDGKILCYVLGYYLDFLILYDQKTQTIQILKRQHSPRNDSLQFFHVNCFNFDQLHKILAGDSC